MKLKIIGAVAALAVAMPLATVTPSMAQGRGDGGVNIGNGFRSYGAGGVLRNGGGGGGGGGHVGGRPGGGGWHGGGHPGGGGWHGGHRHRGGGFFPGFAAGAVIGGALAAPYAYGAGYPYGYYDDDYYDAPAVTVAPGGDSVAYCRSRFKSYDVRSGTYLGYDGLRHPCP